MNPMNPLKHLIWSKADLHLHTTHSDGMATVPELLAHVSSNTDLKVIAITDHDSIVGAKLAARMAARFGRALWHGGRGGRRSQHR